MAKPFGNMAQLTGDILDSYIMGLQAGSTPDDAGLDEMKYVRVDKLRRYIREGLVTAYTPRENSSIATPSSPQVGDIFMCTGEFTESGVTYQLNHFYVYTTQLAWEDITAGIKGPKGDTGVTPLLSVGEVTYGDTPNVTIDTTDPTHPVMNFVLKTSEVGVVDNLTSDSSVDALSAKQGKMLKQDTDALQSQIVNTNAELDNVEALIGGDAQVENVDDTPMVVQSRLIHHANLLPNGSFRRVGARSVAWNQLSNAGQTITNSTTDTRATPSIYWRLKGSPYTTLCVFNASYSAIVTASFTGQTELIHNGLESNIVLVPTFINVISGHKYLFSVTVSGSDPTVVGGIVLNNLQIHDLTAMNEYDSTLTDAQNIANFRAKFPATYYPFNNGSIIPLNPSGFRIRGINLFDGESQIGYYDTLTGAFVSSAGSWKGNTNRIRVNPNEAYYVYIGSSSTASRGYVLFYDINGNYISYTNTPKNDSFTTPANCAYVNFYANEAYFDSDIQICPNSLPTSVKTVYHPYDGHTVETPQISDGHYVNENLYDYVENVVEDGIVKGKKHSVVGSYTFTGNEEWKTYIKCHYTLVVSNIIKKNSSATVVGNILAPFAPTTTVNNLRDEVEKSGIAIGIDGAIAIGFADYANISSLTGKTIYFELATESVTDVEPLRSFGISDYSTIEPITPQTELVNRIDVPFSVKSVSANTLIEQITQNTADIAEEKATRSAQVSALDKRVTNLELKTGDQFEVDYPSDTYGMNGVPSNVEPYAEVTKLRGVSRVKNQLIPNVSSQTNKGVTFTIDTTNHTINMNSNGSPATGNARIYLIPDSLSNGFKGVNGHKYGVFWNLVNFSEGYVSLVNNGGLDKSVVSTSKPYGDIIEQVDNTKGSGFLIQVNSGQTINKTIGYPVLTDLTQYFNGSIPSNANTIAEIQTNYPWLLTPSDYDAGSIVDTTYEAVKSVGVNVWDEQTEVGTMLGGTINSKNAIPVVGSQKYYMLYAGSNPSVTAFYIRFFDRDGNACAGYENVNGVSQSKNSVVTAPSDAVSMMFRMQSYYGTTYLNDIQISACPSGTPSTLNTTYHPYMTDTLTLPSPVTLKGAGSVAEEYYPETERITHPIGSYTFTGQETWNASNNYYRTNIADSTILQPANDTIVPNILVADFIPGEWKTTTDKAVYVGPKNIITDNNKIWFRDTSGKTAEQFAQYMAGKTIYYELATPSADTFVDPILDPYVEVKPNGTVKPVQSQSPEVDSAMTVEYIAS